MSQMDEVRRLRDQAQRLESELLMRQANCRHAFGETFYNPTKEQKSSYSHLEGHGSDPWPVYNYYDVDKPRWTRVCSLCDKEEHTFEQRPSGPSQPYFG
jgi:hypothetical protein